jgi:AsmA protein
MKKAFRILIRIVVLLIVIAIMALTALYIFADPNKLRPVIISEVLKRTGYGLVIDGDLSWSIYPQVGVKAAHITLTAPDKQRPFLDLRRVNIALEPLQLLRGTSKLSGEVHITEVTLMNVHATSALVGLHWQNNILTLRPIQASLYNGSLSGMAHGKDFSTLPVWDWDVTLSHVDMQPLLRDANGSASKLKLAGTGQVRINVKTQGSNVNQMLTNLNGMTDFSLQNGKVEGVDLNYLVKTADALFNKEKIEVPTNIKETSFDSMVGSTLITNGVAQTNNLMLTSSAFKVKGQGSYDLPRQTINLSLLVQSQQELTSQWEIPVLVSGDVTRPTVSLEMSELNKQWASRELQQVKAKVKDKIKENIPGKTGEYLQNLLGN